VEKPLHIPGAGEYIVGRASEFARNNPVGGTRLAVLTLPVALALDPVGTVKAVGRQLRDDINYLRGRSSPE
jgi:uncharacterized protein with ACT and thioredoxin-like domain